MNKNINIDDSIITPNLMVSQNLKIPVSTNGLNIKSTTGNIYYNSSSGLFEGYDGKHSRWSSLGAYEDTKITHNLNVNKNINVLGSIITPNLITSNELLPISSSKEGSLFIEYNYRK